MVLNVSKSKTKIIFKILEKLFSYQFKDLQLSFSIFIDSEVQNLHFLFEFFFPSECIITHLISRLF